MKISAEITEHYRMILHGYHIGSSLEPKCSEGNECDPEHLLWMLDQIETMENYGKANRWLGFVQGVMIREGYTTVQKERDFTRGKFE